jgi:hypothetical protein
MLQANAGVLSDFPAQLQLVVSKNQNATFKDRNPQERIERHTDRRLSTGVHK